MSIQQSQHPSPQPGVYRLTQYLTAVAIIGVLLAAPLQILLAVAFGNAPLFYITGILSLLLLLPLLLYSAATPPVTLTSTGLVLHPGIWPEQRITWEQISALKPYPLLPPAETEPVRRAAVGRQKYQPAAGLMLVVPGLPLPFRAVGFFTGEGFKPVVAVTNRTHTNYDRLAQALLNKLSNKGFE
jgi:hypothetical protein